MGAGVGQRGRHWAALMDEPIGAVLEVIAYELALNERWTQKAAAPLMHRDLEIGQ
jgi:hypothetical protein